MKAIQQKYKIKTSARKVWNALVLPTIINKWGGGPSKMKDEEGFRFSLWKGQIFGKNIKVEKFKLLSQEWYAGRWDQPSVVTFTLSEKDGTTTVVLDHKDLPNTEVKEIERGWKEDYLGPIKKLLEEK